MLHTINKSPFEKNSLESCLRLAKAGSDILLIEDAVYAAMRGTVLEDKVRRAQTQHRWYVLADDLRTRGLDAERVIDGIKIVGYDGFVELAASNERCQSWL